MASSGKLEIKSTNTIKYDAKSFKTYGARILNQLMNNEMYLDSRTKEIFQNELRMHFLEKNFFFRKPVCNAACYL